MGKLNIIQFTFFFFAACCMSSTFAGYKLSETLAGKVLDQVAVEMKASLVYQKFGHYFENNQQALHGFATFFLEQSLEEKKHADKLLSYLNQRDVKYKAFADLDKICEPIENSELCDNVINGLVKGDSNDIDLAIKDAVKLEKFVYDKLEEIIEVSPSDAQLNHYIEHEYLDEQVESIKMLLDYQNQLKHVKGNYIGILLMDRWLLEKKKTEL